MTLSALMIEAFGDDNPYDPEFCPGNSHALIVRDLSPTAAECECGNTLVKVEGALHGAPGLEVYLHEVNRSRLCPPYNCPCGQRHNLTSPARPVPPPVETTAPAVADHEIRFDRQCGSVRAVCSCGWARFGAWYPTRTAEGERLAQKDGERHLRDPEVPAFKPNR